ncbi:hypothetical protein Agub_g8386 [Astrephomene gubernaculifera]|uniref:Uncharacterized protein n=1 Tax=Astrephomene gubernaculifera TaxID=47775 RepID=A0AAD3HNF3_9CHLO|nr:hypothetical protein Agub_g8386 [Astrephomene gubernaculifera]
MDTPSCSVPLEGQPLDCCVSPNAGLLAAGLVTGQLQVASFACPPSADGASSQLSYQLSFTVPPPEDTPSDATDATPSCRAVCFTHDGSAVLAGYSDHIVRSYDTTTGKLVQTFSGEHDQALSRVYALDPNVFVSGDEEGLVVLWDARSSNGSGNGCSGSGRGSSKNASGGGGGGGRGATYRYTHHTDYISDFALNSRAGALVVTSGDATLSVHDLRKRKALARSEDDNDDELLSCCVVKGGRKVVAGSQSGVLQLYSWGHWNDCSDRFPGHPESVQALVAFDESTLLTGSSDGGVRVVGVLPNRLLGILGQHNEDFPVERLALSHDRRVLASTSHDSAVKLWDLSLLLEDDDEGEGEEGEGEGEEEEEGAEAVGGRGGSEGEEEGEEEEGSSDWEEEGESEGEGEEDDDGDDGDSGSGSGSEGGDDSEEEEEKEEGGAGAAGGKGRVKKAVAAAAAKEAGPGTTGATKGAAATAAAAAANQGIGAAVAGGKKQKKKAADSDGDGSGGDAGPEEKDSDDDGEDSDDDDGGRKRKRARQERTKWTRGSEAAKKPAGNFFADLL